MCSRLSVFVLVSVICAMTVFSSCSPAPDSGVEKDSAVGDSVQDLTSPEVGEDQLPVGDVKDLGNP